jgi:paraquat-inducible protein A
LEYDEIIIPEAYPQKARTLRLLVALAMLLLAVGLVAPIVTLNRFILVHNTFSVLSGVVALLREGQYFLFLLLTGFSVVLPVLKLAVLYRLVSRNTATHERMKRLLHWMHLYGKWSMLDVFVVAVLVVSVKLGAIVNVEMRYGLYAFAASVLLTMFVTARVAGLAGRPH